MFPTENEQVGSEGRRGARGEREKDCGFCGGGRLRFCFGGLREPTGGQPHSGLRHDAGNKRGRDAHCDHPRPRIRRLASCSAASARIGLRFADIAVSIPPDAIAQDRRRAMAVLASRRSRPRFRHPARRHARPPPGSSATFHDRLQSPPTSARAGLRPRLQHPLRGGGLSLRADRRTISRRRVAAGAVHLAVARQGARISLRPRERQLLARRARGRVAGARRRSRRREISILAHSLGNYVAVEALRQMAIRDHGLPPKIRNIMLASPDIDVDVFRRQIAEIEVGQARAGDAVRRTGRQGAERIELPGRRRTAAARP